MGQRLGQHFLQDQSVLERIAKAVCDPEEPLVIEIGPGHGALTGHLIGRAKRVIAIEIDRAAAAVARARHGARFELIEGDVMDVDLNQWGPVAVCGNLPYYLTSPILDKTLSATIKHAVFLIQKEVADRLIARPGTRDYGYLTVRTQSRAEVELLFNVGPGAFRPPPKVDSAVVRLKPLANPAVEDINGFLKFAGICFQQKRKTLRNNLRSFYGDRVAQLGDRAEQLSIAQLAELWRELRSEHP